MSARIGLLSLAPCALALLARAHPATGGERAEPARGERPNVVVVLWNDTNLERVGFLRGGEQDPAGVTPHLDSVFAEGAHFPRGLLVATRGRPTSASALSGLHPHQSGVYYHAAGRLLAPEETLSGRLHAAGYAGFHVGKFHEGEPAAFGFEGDLKGLLAEGSRAVTSFVDERAGKQPLLVWWSPEVPEGYGAKNLDQALGELLAALEAKDERENTLFVFLMNGDAKAQTFSAEECTAKGMRAPLALAGPLDRAGGRVPAGRHEELVTPLDVLPTVLDLVGLSPAARGEGRSLRALVQGGTFEPRTIGAAFYEHAPSGSRSAYSIDRNLRALAFLDGRYKYAIFLDDIGIHVDEATELLEIERSAGDQLLFDLERDPEEARNLFLGAEHEARMAAMRAALLAWWRASGGAEFPLPYLPPSLGRPPEEPHPNIVLVVADDMDYEHLGFLGNPRARTPTLDELARTGVVFPVAHVPMSLCRPSLAALLSGRWPHQNGIYANESTRILARRDSLPNLLKAAGYATFVGGKFWEGSQLSMGFIAPEKVDAVFERFVREDQDELFRFIDRYHAERPLFLWWAPMLPHRPFDPPERLRALFRDTEVPVPAFIEGDPRAFQEAERTAYAMDAWFDDGLRTLREKLAACGELEDTLFVFLIDNGYANGFPSKGTVFEKGLRTPIVVSWPKGITGGSSRPELVSTVDLYRTLLDYAGVAAPEGASGLDLRAALEGRSTETRDAIYGAVYQYRERGGPQRPENSAYALYARTQRWKLVHYLRNVDTESFKHEFAATEPFERGERALYDLEQDPYERHDLSGDPAQAARMEELFQQALAWWRATGGGELDLSTAPGDTPGRKKGKKPRQGKEPPR